MIFPAHRADTLRQRRWHVTRASNRVRSTIEHNLTAPAPTVYDGLPSWWGFWSDALKDNVRQLVRYARHLEEGL